MERHEGKGIEWAVKPVPMEYGDGRHCNIIARGAYRGMEFAVISKDGWFPCGYVNVKGTSLDGMDYDHIDGIDCHGGLTYSENRLLLDYGGWWIGWDYGHNGDYCGFTDFGGRRYTTEEVVEECKRVIDQVIDKERGRLPQYVAEKIAEHYAHAKRKHPYFADRLFIYDNDGEDAKRDLESVRMLLQIEREQDKVYAETLANCEVAEVCDAIARGETAHAAEKCYDAIAVLLRMVDVLEGRQKLGK